jgi:HEAT repeat protein
MSARLPSLALAGMLALGPLAGAALADALEQRRLDDGIADVLSIGDEVVTKARLDAALGPAPVEALRTIVGRTEAADDAAQIRAVRALGHYATPQSRQSLHDVLSSRGHCQGDGAAVSGADAVYVRAALEALGAIHDPADVEWIVPCLQAKSRDLRVAAARALRDLGASTAVCPLQAQRAVERVPQVVSALSEALRKWPAQICPSANSVRQRTAE